MASGQRLYRATCAPCHGVDLRGTSQGPPFLDPIYAPNHHPDGAFYAAVAGGVRPHHWNFGPMPAIPSLQRSQVTDIIAYVRAEQQRAGITADPSHP